MGILDVFPAAWVTPARRAEALRALAGQDLPALLRQAAGRPSPAALLALLETPAGKEAVRQDPDLAREIVRAALPRLQTRHPLRRAAWARAAVLTGVCVGPAVVEMADPDLALAYLALQGGQTRRAAWAVLRALGQADALKASLQALPPEARERALRLARKRRVPVWQALPREAGEALRAAAGAAGTVLGRHPAAVARDLLETRLEAPTETATTPAAAPAPAVSTEALPPATPPEKTDAGQARAPVPETPAASVGVLITPVPRAPTAGPATGRRWSFGDTPAESSLALALRAAGIA